mmetsp:Transcript_34673/g.99256  ORF Transcript_34673/g.99256 Transcript_34673/m.99256 type:complete len:316 (-) Transcript_34673:627-1574(-)
MLLHPAQSLQSPSVQFTGASQGVALQVTVCRVAPAQGLPPCAARCFTRRMLVFTPPPQLALQVVHSPQSVRTQSTGSGPPQGRVSFHPPVHDSPLPLCSVFARRLRKLCALLDAHGAQSSHASQVQFRSSTAQLLCRHSGRAEVSERAPSQGAPHSLFEVLTLRLRSQSPEQLPMAFQPLQSSSSQSRGTHASLQLGRPSHVASWTSRPLHEDTARGVHESSPPWSPWGVQPTWACSQHHLFFSPDQPPCHLSNPAEQLNSTSSGPAGACPLLAPSPPWWSARAPPPGSASLTRCAPSSETRTARGFRSQVLAER